MPAGAHDSRPRTERGRAADGREPERDAGGRGGDAARAARRAAAADSARVRLPGRATLLPSVVAEADDPRETTETGRGWVAVRDRTIVGFAVVNARTGNLWALFVDPRHEARGIGRRLHDEALAWLFAQGAAAAWLTTEPDTRASRFYERAGWRATSTTPAGERRYELDAP